MVDDVIIYGVVVILYVKFFIGEVFSATPTTPNIL